MNIGDRVIHEDGSIGHIEAIDNCQEYPTYDVRWLTPKNKPSCYISICPQRIITQVTKKVVPMPKSKAWFLESLLFYTSIKEAVNGFELGVRR